MTSPARAVCGEAVSDAPEAWLGMPGKMMTTSPSSMMTVANQSLARRRGGLVGALAGRSGIHLDPSQYGN
jgi:hypothetical protein